MTTPIPKNNTASTAPKHSAYTTFYLVMLILSSVGTALSTFAVFQIIDLAIHFSDAPLYASLVLLNIGLIPFAITALILLYQKHKLGFYLLVGTLLASLAITVALAFTADQMLDYTYAAMGPADDPALADFAHYAAFVKFGWYIGMAFDVVTTITVIVLWHFAWKNQTTADNK